MYSKNIVSGVFTLCIFKLYMDAQKNENRTLLYGSVQVPRLVGFDRNFSTWGMSIYSVCERQFYF